MIFRPYNGGHRRSRRRKESAYTLAEFGPTLLLAFCLIILPILAFGMIGARYVFCLNAARLAVQQAARCKTFLSDTSPTDRSAVNTAKSVAANAINGIGKGMVSLTATNVFIKICPLGAGPGSVTTPGANIPLPAPADTANNTYNCECVLQCVVQPLFPGAKNFLGGIPGFNAPINTNVRMDCFFESEANLNQ